MRIRFRQALTIGGRSYAAGEVAEVSPYIAHACIERATAEPASAERLRAPGINRARKGGRDRSHEAEDDRSRAPGHNRVQLPGQNRGRA